MVVVGWGEVGVLGEEEGIAAAVKTFEVLEGDGGFGAGDFDRAAFLPMPFGSFVSEGFESFSIDENLEFSGSAGGVPGGDPVLGADVEVVGADGGKGDFLGGVSHGSAHAMGDEVGRAHVENKLGVGRPAAAVFEGFGFEEDGVGSLSREGECSCGEDFGDERTHRDTRLRFERVKRALFFKKGERDD